MRTNETMQSATDSYAMEINVSETMPECDHGDSAVIGGATYDGQSYEVHRCNVCGMSWETPADAVPDLTGEVTP